MRKMVPRSISIHPVLASMLFVAALSGTARANYFTDDTLVSASAGQVSTSWINGNPYKSGDFRMVDTAHNVCFLTGVSGDFNGSGERAYVYEDRGYWAIGVSSGSGQGVIATASCIAIPDQSYQWPAPTSPGTFWFQEYFYPMKILVPQPRDAYHSWTCFLTQVRGHFQGSGERLEVYQTSDFWAIGGNSGTSGLMGEARCVETTGKSRRFNGSQDRDNTTQMMYAGGTNYSEYPNNYSYTYPSRSNSCFLQRMMGRFEGIGERISVVADGQDRIVGWPNYWWFDITSQQSGVSGAAQCVW
jgi:hypothetical protein